MKRQQWIDHTFNLDIDLGWTKNVLCRIEDTAIRIDHQLKNLSDEQCSKQLNKKWSIKEHIGHLTDLEELWINRFQQFEKGFPELVAADMSNQKTKEASHNELSANQLLTDFTSARKELVTTFQNLSDQAKNHEAFHPRIKSMMKPVDLLFFIAEHDDHHLVSIKELMKLN